jgi:biopolymer transport protein ExbD
MSNPTHIMAYHKRLKTQAEAEPTLDVSSLIDVCFLLLIYFIVTSTITPRESDLGMGLAANRPNVDTQVDLDPLFIRIEASGAILTGVDGLDFPMDSDASSRELPLLGSHLDMYAQAARAAGSLPLVRIHADGAATQQRVIDVLNALAGSGISAVAFTDLVDF